MVSDKLDKYFLSLHAELWPGEAFYISQPEGRAEAIAWAEKLLAAIQ